MKRYRFKTLEEFDKTCKRLEDGSYITGNTKFVENMHHLLGDVSGCRTLYLTLSKMPFEVMVTGEKSTEYREPSKWILSRLQGKDYDLIKFVNGYGSNKPYFIAKFRGWEIETNPYSVDFSNGLKVTTKKGTVKIYAGEIVERGNLNGCH